MHNDDEDWNQKSGFYVVQKVRVRIFFWIQTRHKSLGSQTEIADVDQEFRKSRARIQTMFRQILTDSTGKREI